MAEAPKHLQGSDLRAAARLATEATAGLVDLVEAVHERIARLPGLAAPAQSGRTSGITGLVYKTVRGATRVVGGSVDALLGWLEPVVADGSAGLATPEREAVIAALNGVLGDHLAATGNALATTMALRSAGQPLTLQAQALAASLPAATARVLVLVHGLCMNDLQWTRAGHDHGAALARDGGYTPLYLHYNSGLHVSDNGAQFAALMQALVAQWPQPIERLAVVGHSMGGLVARSAVHQARQAEQAWAARLDDLVCLGTPHHGAPLERAGHGVDLLLGATPYSAPFARLGKLRSAGITDLRHGNLLPADWQAQERFGGLGAGSDRRTPVRLPDGVRCYTVAASLGRDSGDLKHRLTHSLVGDGLVPLDSALGRHKNPAQQLDFPPERQWVGHGIGHLDLLSSIEVASCLKRWLAAPGTPP
jgi:pimeloyl-ACP methyl ester carboxylesterase